MREYKKNSFSNFLLVEERLVIFGLPNQAEAELNILDIEYHFHFL